MNVFLQRLPAGFLLLIMLFVISCGGSTQSESFLVGQTSFVGTVIDQSNPCQITFELSNLVQEQTLLVEVSLWLRQADGQSLMLDSWQEDTLLNFFSGDQFLFPRAVQRYFQDFSAYASMMGNGDAFYLQFIGLSGALSSTALTPDFCENGN